MSENANETLIRELFDSVDLDSSGYIDETELAAVVDLTPDDLQTFFQRLDSDNDGKISIEDFIENYRQFQKIANRMDNKNDSNKTEKNIQTDILPEKLSIMESEIPSKESDFSDKSSVYDSGCSITDRFHKLEKSPLKTDIKRKAARHIGQEYLDDLYEIARSRKDPLLLESLENFLTATVENLLQKQSENEKLDTALKRATEKNTEIVYELEHEMEQQVAILEAKIREEEKVKLEQQKHEANAQILTAQQELNEMELKVKKLEDKVNKQVNEIPDSIIDVIQKKDQQNEQLQRKLLEFQTQMALMRTEVANMKAEYDEQANRLVAERGTVFSCVQEQENLTRQLHLLHEANRKLHDTNDDLRSALDSRRSMSLSHSFTMSHSPVKTAYSVQSPIKRTVSGNTFRSDPGAYRLTKPQPSSTAMSVNSDLNDTDDDTYRSVLPHDELPDNNSSFINGNSLMNEIIEAEGGGQLYMDPMCQAPTPDSYIDTPNSDREQFVRQLEILCETNRRLGESNDELRQALGLLSDRLRSNNSMDADKRPNPTGCQSAPVTPYKSHPLNLLRPQSTSSPRKVLLTKSGYHSLSMYARRQSDEDIDEDDISDEELVRLVDQTNEDDNTISMTDDPITVEEKVLEQRGSAVGADTSNESVSGDGFDGDMSIKPEKMFKLVLAGNAAVGKSSFIIRLCKDKFYSALNSTLGVDFQLKSMTVDDVPIALQLWDTAGQERFRSIAKSYFRRVDGVVLLYDVTCENSFIDVRDWLESIRASATKDIPIIICGNKVDLRPYAVSRGMPCVSRRQGEKLAKEVGALFIETSAKDGVNVNKACHQLAKKLLACADETTIYDETEGGISLEENNNIHAKPRKSGCCKS